MFKLIPDFLGPGGVTLAIILDKKPFEDSVSLQNEKIMIGIQLILAYC